MSFQAENRSWRKGEPRPKYPIIIDYIVPSDEEVMRLLRDKQAVILSKLSDPGDLTAEGQTKVESIPVESEGIL